jgi:hypothetical protein
VIGFSSKLIVVPDGQHSIFDRKPVMETQFQKKGLTKEVHSLEIP